MTAKTFFNNIANGKEDVIEYFLNVLNAAKTDYCVIGGLAVNAYAEPVVSLDLDIVVAIEKKAQIVEAMSGKFKVEQFPHSLNLTSSESDIRIQIQTDSRYQDFIKHALTKEVMGYSLRVASLEDVLQGKVWAYQDETRRKSKRQKDLADILRLVETHPSLREKLPPPIRSFM